MNSTEQARINALNAAYLKEEPPVQNFTWEGYEAWKDSRQKAPIVATCIGKTIPQRCYSTCPMSRQCKVADKDLAEAKQ
jgi:hypothetical protein